MEFRHNNDAQDFAEEISTGNLFAVASEKSGTDLSLTGFETVDQARDGPFVVHVREQDQLLVDEIRVRDILRILVVQIDFRHSQFAAVLALLHTVSEPCFPLTGAMISIVVGAILPHLFH